MQSNPAYSFVLRRWLLAVMALVVLMVGVGGVTRLTESGLSIVEWKLMSGILPPMSKQAWQAEFNDYKTSPQYQKVNRDFTVNDFKHIYWLEYLHRLIGRLLGLAVILPAITLAVYGMLSRDMKWRALLFCILIASQGTVGWIMVASGLVDQPRVEPLKLALHLVLAFLFFLTMLWTYWQLGDKRHTPASRGVAYAARGLFALILLQIVFGALVAGLRAGLSYNTYPLMDGQFIPDGLHRLHPWWLNHVESVLTVQFQHRMGALAVVAGAFSLIAYAWHKVADKRPLKWLGAVVILQFLLGVGTLLGHVPVALASAHQLTALLLLGIGLMLINSYPIRKV